MLVAVSILVIASAATRAPLDALVGVYRHSFPDALVTGETYTGEDILEIVKISPNTAYVRAHLDFFNGHTCGLFGVADLEGDSLVYRDPTEPPAGHGRCVLTFSVTPDKLVFDDGEGTCQSYCGARGSFHGAAFSRASRRAIRYLPRLLNSNEYKAALKERADETAKAPAR